MKQICLFFFTVNFICSSAIGSFVYVLTGTTMIGHTTILMEILSGIVTGVVISIILSVYSILMLEYVCSYMSLLEVDD